MTVDEKKVRLMFVGDVSFGDCLFCQGMGMRSLARIYPKEHFFAEVAPHLKEADIAFCNLETVLSRSGEDDSDLATVDMRGDPESIEALKSGGFAVVNFANNHAAQHGPDAFHETVALLSIHGFKVAGLKSDGACHSAPVIVEKRGEKIGFLGYSFVHDRVFSTLTPYADGEVQRIISDIRLLRKSVGFLVVSVHWGLEFLDHPSARTARWAHAFIDAGADAVIGHHPHVLQGMESYRGKLIAYSLGNFLFDMLWSREYRETLILEIAWNPNGGMEWKTVPAYIGRDGKVSLLAGRDALRAHEKIERLCGKISRGHELGFASESDYQREYDRRNNAGRIKSYLYFLANFHRYQKRYLLQQVKRTIDSRIEDFRALLRGNPPS